MNYELIPRQMRCVKSALPVVKVWICMVYAVLQGAQPKQTQTQCCDCSGLGEERENPKDRKLVLTKLGFLHDGC